MADGQEAQGWVLSAARSARWHAFAAVTSGEWVMARCGRLVVPVEQQMRVTPPPMACVRCEEAVAAKDAGL